MTPERFVAELRAQFEVVAVPEDAEPMAAYMKHRAPFLGVKAPARKTAQKQLCQPRPADQDAALDVANALWEQPEREFQHTACDYLRRHLHKGDGDAARTLDRLRHLIVTKSWWDTVDALSPTLGLVVQAHPGLVHDMDDWSTDDNLWVVRSAILHQLRYKEATDADRLFTYCQHQAGHKDFFVRKAIGWALRQYGRTNPDAVRTFVDRHHEELSGLSIREAMKHL